MRLIHDQKQKAQRKRPSILPSSVRLQAIARLRLVWADYQKRVFLLSNLPVEMPVDHLIEFNDLMPDRLEMELIRTGNLPLSPLGLEKMQDNFGLSKGAAKKLFQRSKASDPKRLLTQLPTLVRTTVQIATFKAGNERKTPHRHLYYRRITQAALQPASTPRGLKQKYYPI